MHRFKDPFQFLNVDTVVYSVDDKSVKGLLCLWGGFQATSSYGSSISQDHPQSVTCMECSSRLFPCPGPELKIWPDA